MKVRKTDFRYVLENYYRDRIDLDTCLDARHLVSVLTSLCPDIQITYRESELLLNNICNHMHRPILITWKYGI